jgi:hypothetical protein
MSAKPSSTAVERLWNSFGDNLTAKRRSILNETLQMLVYTKMNHGVLKHDGVDLGSVDVKDYGFQSILEFVDELIEEELWEVQRVMWGAMGGFPQPPIAVGGAEGHVHVEADAVELSGDAISSSGAADDW